MQRKTFEQQVMEAEQPAEPEPDFNPETVPGYRKTVRVAGHNRLARQDRDGRVTPLTDEEIYKAKTIGYSFTTVTIQDPPQIIENLTSEEARGLVERDARMNGTRVVKGGNVTVIPFRDGRHGMVPWVVPGRFRPMLSMSYKRHQDGTVDVDEYKPEQPNPNEAWELAEVAADGFGIGGLGIPAGTTIRIRLSDFPGQYGYSDQKGYPLRLLNMASPKRTKRNAQAIEARLAAIESRLPPPLPA